MKIITSKRAATFSKKTYDYMKVEVLHKNGERYNSRGIFKLYIKPSNQPNKKYYVEVKNLDNETIRWGNIGKRGSQHFRDRTPTKIYGGYDHNLTLRREQFGRRFKKKLRQMWGNVMLAQILLW